jgi:hypothetical protein
MAVSPIDGHTVREGDVDVCETRAREHSCRGVGGATCLNDDPCERVGHVAEGVEESGEVERLERAGVGRGDYEHLPRLLDAVPAPLLLLHALHNPVRPHHLDGVRVRPRPDPNPVPPDDYVALRVPGRARRRRLQGGTVGGGVRGRVRGGKGERECVGGCGGGGGSRGRGGGRAQDCGGGGGGGGVVERGGGEEHEEEEPREAEAEEERDEAAERVEKEPEGRGGGRLRPRTAAVGRRRPIGPRAGGARRAHGGRRRAPQPALRQQRLHHRRCSRIWLSLPAAAVRVESVVLVGGWAMRGG